MKKFPGEGQTYLSADSVAEDDLHNTYSTDFLNSVTVSGMPPHAMTLKVGAPVMLLQNLRAGPGNGLQNGTRLIILQLRKRVIEAEIASGVNKGKSVLISCIPIAPSDTELPFTLKRSQFPFQSDLALPCLQTSPKDKLWNLLPYTSLTMSLHVDNCTLHSVEFKTPQLWQCLSTMKMVSQETLFTRKFCNYSSRCLCTVHDNTETVTCISSCSTT